MILAMIIVGDYRSPSLAHSMAVLEPYHSRIKQSLSLRYTAGLWPKLGDVEALIHSMLDPA